MSLSLLKDGKHWNARPAMLGGKPATELHVGWVNYLDVDDDWFRIDCIVQEIGGVFLVVDAPFECTMPQYADGEAIFNCNNHFDVFNKTKITANDFSMTMTVLDASHVQGQLFDINGDGRMDAVIYPQAFQQWDADLIYYVQHGRAPRLQKLIRFNSALGNSIQAEFHIEYSGTPEISTEKIPQGKTRRQWRDDCKRTLDTPSPLNQDNGFYVRAWDEPQKRGIGIKDIMIWDSSTNISGPKRETINANIRKSGAGYKLTKHINKTFFNDAVLPVFTDTTSTFYPDAHPETTSVDGIALQFYGEGAGQSWATLIGAAGNLASDDGINMGAVISSDKNPAWLRNDRDIVLFDTSSIPDGDTIDSAVFSLYGTVKTDPLSILPDINIYSSNPASNTALISGDYTSLGSTNLSIAIGFNAFTLSAYNDFILNATGLALIDKAGITKLGIRNENYDVDAVAPSWSNLLLTLLLGGTADRAGTDNDPKLVVVHTGVVSGAAIMRRRRN